MNIEDILFEHCELLPLKGHLASPLQMKMNHKIKLGEIYNIITKIIYRIQNVNLYDIMKYNTNSWYNTIHKGSKRHTNNYGEK
jgi:hypothetical protein